MPVFNNILAGAAGSGGAAGYEISRSLRFNSGHSAYLSRDFSTSSNRKTFTFSCWIKRCSSDGNSQYLFVGSNASGTPRNDTNFACLRFTSADQLEFAAENTSYRKTNAVFRDFSAWMHIVLAVDTTNSTPNDKIKLYVNGVEIDSFASSTNPADNKIFGINQGTVHTIGVRAREETTLAHYQDAYLADVHFIDGQQLAATDFGAPDADTGVWNPTTFAGSHGSNGFHLDFSDNSTNAALGTDSSGNGNTWDVTNLLADAPVSTTAITNVGATIDNTRTITVTAAGWQNPINAIDSTDSSVSSSNNNTPGTITFSPALVGVTKVRAKTRFYGSGEARLYNGSTQVHSVNHNNNNNTQYYTIYEGPPIEITQYWQQMQAASASDDFWALEINGAIVATNTNGGNLSSTHSGQSITLTTTNNNNYSALAAGDLVNKGAQISSIDSGNSQITVSAGSWSTGDVITKNSSSECDSLLDTPTNYEASFGNNGGNYATWNPLDVKTTIALSNGNLDLVGSSDGRTRATLAMPSGKWYWEITVGAVPASNHVGVWATNVALSNDTYRAIYRGDGYWIVGGSAGSGWSSVTTGNIIGITFDASTRETKFYKNNSLLGTKTAPALPSGSAYTPAVILAGSNSSLQANFGARPFAYTPPTGFKSLCTQNLDDPLIADGSTAMDVVTYTGSASGGTFDIPNFNPGFIWSKNRSTTAGTNHILQDIVRGYGDNKSLYSNLSNDESGTNNIMSVSGKTVTYGTNSNFTGSMVSWAWNAPTSFSNSANGATVASTGKVNQSAGFSIVTWTGTAHSQTVAHGLGAAPKMIIVKSRDQTQPWVVYHSALGKGGVLQLHDPAANITTYSEYWGADEPSSTVFGTYTGGHPWANNYDDMVAYCFAPVEGYSAFGSYTGSSGLFVYTGFRPRWLLIKLTSGTSDWRLFDTARSSFNTADKLLFPSSDEPEATASNYNCDILSNGFKMRNTHAGLNANTSTYIYAAFAENPFKTARAR